MKTIHVGNLTIDGSKLFLIAGPCVIEGYDRTLMIGREIKKSVNGLGYSIFSKLPMTKPTGLPSIPSADRDWKRAWKFWRILRRSFRYRYCPMSTM